MTENNYYARTFDEFVDILATNSPHATILEWWRRVDRSIDSYFEEKGIRRPSRWGESESLLAADPKFWLVGVQLIQELRCVRNRVAHDEIGPLSKEQAEGFARSAFRIVGTLVFGAPRLDGRP